MMEWTGNTSALFFTLPAIVLLIGALIGLILGLTGSGGSLIAVPLLVVLLHLELPEAVGISLAVVAFSAMVGAFHHLLCGSIIWLPTLFFGLLGSAATPLGYLLGQFLSPLMITLLFCVLTLTIARMMWKKAQSNGGSLSRANASFVSFQQSHRDNTTRGYYRTWRSVALIAIAAVLTGVLSGLFGVGGGFVIVPALTLLLGMKMHYAVASSLVIISLVSSVGFYQYFVLTPIINTQLITFLMIGSAIGMVLGIWLSRSISSEKLQKIFSVIIVSMALLMVFKQL